MKSKKMVSLTLAAATSAALLAGCGSSNTANQAASTASTQAAAETSTAAAATSEAADTAATTAAASGDVQKIVVYRAAYNVADPDTDEVTKVQDAINQYLLEKGHNVQVEIHDINNAEYADKANMAWNNGEVNLMWTSNWWATIGTDDLYKNKSAYDITDLLPGTDLYKAIPESYWAGCRYDGRDYYVPIYKEGAEGYKVKMLQSNLDAIGVTADEVTKAVDAADNTWDKLAALEPFMDKAVDAGIRYPFVFAGTNMFYRFGMDKYDFVVPNMYSMIGVDAESGEVVDPLLTDDYSKFCKMMARWADKGYVNADDEIGSVVDASATQTQDWLFNWWTSVPNDKESEGRDGNQKEEFATLTNTYSTSRSTLGSCFAISAKSTEDQAKACIDFLGVLETDPVVGNLYTYGIEGTDYVLTDGKVDRTQEGTGTLYNHSPWESTSVKAVTLEVNEPDNKVEMYDTFNNDAKTYPSTGFRFNADAAGVTDKVAACIDKFNTYGKSLELGGYTEDQVDSTIKEFQSELDGAGYQDILKACQDQYAAWKAEQ